MSPNVRNFEESENVEMEQKVLFTDSHLEYLNQQLEKLSPKKILEWALVSLPGLYQTTAFGLTGLAILDMISKVSIERAEENATSPRHLVPLVFLDTLYHFPETVELANRAAKFYNAPLYVFKPANCETVQDFENNYGDKLWENEEQSYDYLVKVEPSRRAYKELKVSAVITGRRRSQRGARESIKTLEIEKGTGLIKLNPLANWDFNKVWTYIRANEVPFNPLLNKGYRSIGDWHSTKPTTDSSSERSGRWEGQNKTECGLHEDYFKMRAAFMASQKKKEAREKAGTLQVTSLESNVAPLRSTTL